MRHVAKLAMALVLAAPVLPVVAEDGVPAALAVPLAVPEAAVSTGAQAPAEAGSVTQPAPRASPVPAAGAVLGPVTAAAAPASAAPPASATAPAAVATAVPAFGPALSTRRLEALRGGSDTPWSDMKLQGTVSGNSAVAVASGANLITEGAFSNASGLPMVIQNSGANVLIQNATIVNVQFK